MRLGLIATLLSGAFLAGCGGKQVPRDELNTRPPAIPGPSYVWEGLPSNLKFDQGVYREFDIYKYARVDRGQAVVEARNLPDGATFDGRILKWKPACGFPELYVHGRGIAEHEVDFVLSSDIGDGNFVERNVTLLVYEFNVAKSYLTCEEFGQ